MKRTTGTLQPHNARAYSSRRYSEFEELHKQLKKVVDTPEFPPKKVLKFSHKVVEQRRVALELYLQGILESETIPRSFFKFLEVHLPRSGSILPDIVVQGVREGLYSNDTYDIQGLVQ
ncbi:SNX24-like protein [Mya arenaria]|uniref:SNX24-like protein n=1 Tax=Mya arenaria TaxID=6604 RepID=A0ABY7DMD3_MYAAR|nr:SNX24-like protein [Mya arenaria]